MKQRMLSIDRKKASSSVEQDPNLLNPVPKFSIRDYVSSSRSKSLSNNWPFSKKYLELCMKHGVSDPLPPFLTPDSVRRNPFLKRKCSGEKFYCDDVGKIHQNDDSEVPKKQDEKLKLGLCKDNRAASDCWVINLCGYEETDTDFVSKNTSLKLQKHKGKEEVITGRRHPPVKKSKFVKSTSKETVILPKNYIVMPESMVSKCVCPICEAFTSSSNTALNAHIDRCLSGELTIFKCAKSLPVTKYKVKPKKTRVMVDIYKSAPRCTLEELERRNGRSWSTHSRFQVQSHSIGFKDNGNKGDVSIDEDGTKVQILSEFSGIELGSKIGGDDNGARKLLKGNKVKKNLLPVKKEKKPKVQKQAKYLKDDKNYLAPKTFLNYEACGSSQGRRKEPISDKLEKVEMPAKHFKDNQNQIKKHNLGSTVKPSSSTLIQNKTYSNEDVLHYFDSGHNSNTKFAVESSNNPTLAPTGNQWGGNDLNRRAWIARRMEMFNPPSSRTENADIDGVKSPMRRDFPVKVSSDSASPSPASNYPVFRLYGKDQMVVNNDQDWSPLQK